MYIAMNRFPVAKGSEAAFETMWAQRDTHLRQVPGDLVDEVLEVSDNHIVARFTFRQDHDFYRGHFPGHRRRAR